MASTPLHDRQLHQCEDHRAPARRDPTAGRIDSTGRRHRIANLRKLGPYPRQDSLAFAMREIGRIERSLFMLAWLEDPALRRRVTAGPNKDQARNALARAAFFNRLAEIRDRSFENQRRRASGLNLVVAAITLWNTVYLERNIANGKTKAIRSRPALARLSAGLGAKQSHRRLHLAQQQVGSQGWLQTSPKPEKPLCRP